MRSVSLQSCRMLMFVLILGESGVRKPKADPKAGQRLDQRRGQSEGGPIRQRARQRQRERTSQVGRDNGESAE